jgi:hypothetical protein
LILQLGIICRLNLKFDMSSDLRVLSHLFPREGVQLGRLVTNVKAPHGDYYPKTKLRYLKSDVYSITGKDFLDIRKKNTNSKLSLVLDHVLTGILGNTSNAETGIANTICITYFLDNSEDKFKKLCEHPQARQ